MPTVTIAVDLAKNVFELAIASRPGSSEAPSVFPSAVGDVLGLRDAASFGAALHARSMPEVSIAGSAGRHASNPIQSGVLRALPEDNGIPVQHLEFVTTITEAWCDAWRFGVHGFPTCGTSKPPSASEAASERSMTGRATPLRLDLPAGTAGRAPGAAAEGPCDAIVNPLWPGEHA
jgi:hypothetical protein